MMTRVRQNRKWSPGARPSRSRKGLSVRILWCLSLVAVIGLGGWYGWRQAGPDVMGWADHFVEITVVEITKTERMSREDVLRILDLEPGRGLLFIDPERAQRALETHPWIQRAIVRRRFPHTLEVELDEREPVAVLKAGSGGRAWFLDRDGMVITTNVPHTEDDLPILTGVDYTEAILGGDETVARVRAGLALAALLDRSGVGRTEVDIRRPDDLVVYASGFRLRFGAGDFTEKMGRYQQVSDLVHEREGAQAKAAPARLVEVDLRFQDKVILREGR